MVTLMKNFGLNLTLAAKIIVTIIWVVSLPFARSAAARRLGFPEPKPLVWMYLLGAAWTALLVGYCRALWDNMHRKRETDTVRQESVTNTIWMGLVSNGLACILLLGFRREWSGWGQRRSGVCGPPRL